ncbi:hypothetical protein HDV02_002741 [Globomyces sp. JEL0801]|nr:hypothetical protein HDV02_002741 [Globomyces sp. JEL0801]
MDIQEIMNPLLELNTNQKVIEKSFSTMLLGSFERDSDSLVTGIELTLNGYDVATTSLTFVPSGNAAFGMFIDHLGFLPITKSYPWSEFSFESGTNTQFRFWFYKDKDTSKTPLSMFKVNNNKDILPINCMPLIKELGRYRVLLKDEFGVIGCIEYEIKSNDQIPAPELIGEQPAGDVIDNTMIVGDITRVCIHPNAIFAIPL